MTENVRRSARALLFEGDGCLVLIKRTKTGQEPYWVTVGGGEWNRRTSTSRRRCAVRSSAAHVVFHLSLSGGPDRLLLPHSTLVQETAE